MRHLIAAAAGISMDGRPRKLRCCRRRGLQLTHTHSLTLPSTHFNNIQRIAGNQKGFLILKLQLTSAERICVVCIFVEMGKFSY